MYQNWLPWILYLFLVIEFHHVLNLSWDFHLNYYNDLIHHITVILYYTRTLGAYGLEFLLYSKFGFWQFLLSKTRKSKFSLLIFGGCWPPILSIVQANQCKLSMWSCVLLIKNPVFSLSRQLFLELKDFTFLWGERFPLEDEEIFHVPLKNKSLFWLWHRDVFLQLVLQARGHRNNLVDGSVSWCHMPEFLFSWKQGFFNTK